MRRAAVGLVLGLGLLAGPASAHPKGFHKRVTLVVSRHEVQGVVVLDVDGGERCAVLRAGADADRDGLLSKEELSFLRQRLEAMALRTLKVAFSSQVVPLKAVKTKLSLREDHRASDTGLSVAVLLHQAHAFKLTPGLHLEVEDVSPDGSAVALDVFQAPPTGRSGGAPFRGEVAPGQMTRVRLGALGDVPASAGGFPSPMSSP